MTRQSEAKGGKIELLLARLIIATGMNGDTQRLIEAQNAGAAFAFAVRAEEGLNIGGNRKAIELGNQGLLDGELGVHVRHLRGLGLNGAIDLFIGGFGVIMSRTAR